MIDLAKPLTVEVARGDLDGLRHRIGHTLYCDFQTGKWRCPCGVALTNQDVIRCPKCEPERVRQQIEDDERRRREEIQTLRNDLQHADLFRQLPRLRHARVDDPKFQKEAPEPFRAFANGWQPKHGSVNLSGPSGTWKTSSLIALAHQLAKSAWDELPNLPFADLKGKTLAGQLSRSLWVTAHDLLNDASWHRLGDGPPPLVRRAVNAPILFLDEIRGPDPKGLLFDIVNQRYTEGRPTLATTGMSKAQFCASFDGGLWRRLVEPGTGRLLEADGQG